LAAVVTLTWVVGQIKFRYGFVGAPFEAMIALSVLCAAAQIALVYYGFFRRNGDGSPAARHWPALRLLAGLGLAVALVGATIWSLDAAVTNRLASLRVEAGALAMSVAPPRVPDHRNAAMVYRQAFEVLAAHRDDLARCRKGIHFQPADWLSLDPGELGLREMVGKLQPAVRLLRRGAAVPECCFDLDWSRLSMATILSEAQDLRQGAEVLVADVVVKTKDGRTTEALEDISALFGIAAHVKQEPFAVTLLIAKSVEEIALEALEHVLARARPTPAELTSLKLPPQLVSYVYALQRVFRAEEAMWLGEASDGGNVRALLEMALRPSGDRTSLPAALGVWATLYRVFLIEGDLAAYQKEIKRWGRELAGPEPFRHEPFPFGFVEHGRDRPMAAQLGPVPGEFLDPLRWMWSAAGKAEAVQRLAWVAAAAARFRASAKADLQRLDQLVPEYLDAVPLDPFDGKPLKMVRTDKGLVLYSIGPDKKDDGGSPPKAEDWRLGDVSIRLPK
jgi:hypothetical protein